MARLRLGEFLVQKGLIDEMQLNAALAHQRQWGGFLGQILVDQGFVDEMSMYRALAQQLGMDLVSIPDMRPAPNVVRCLPTDLCQSKNLVPVGVQQRTLIVATALPQDIQVQDDIAFRTGMKVHYVIAPQREIEWAIRHYHMRDPSPCPPPKTKRVLPTEEEFKIVDAAGNTVMKSIDQLRAEHEARKNRMGAPVQSGPMPAAPGPVTVGGTAGGPSAGNTAALEQQLAELRSQLDRQSMLLRSLIELCVQKGFFRQDEYVAYVQAKQQRPH